MALDLTLETAKLLSLPPAGVGAVVELLQGGATVPFIARYRKEATGGLDEVQIRAIEERHRYLSELESRKCAILFEIDKQGKLTPALRAAIEACTLKAELEDLYLPYKPKRRTRAQMARERGLEPLAQRILLQPPSGNPEVEAAAFVNAEKGVLTAQDALAGARDIVAETVAEQASVRAYVRELFVKEGVLVADKNDKVTGPTKFEAYYGFAEPVKALPSHRFLAIQRGENEGVLSSRIEVDADRAKARIGALARDLRAGGEPRGQHSRDLGVFESARMVDVESTRNGLLAGSRGASPFATPLREAIDDCYKRLLAPSIESEVRAQVKVRADHDAIKIFAQNLRALLLGAPLGARPVLGIDPGQRTGCKVAVVDATGKLLEHTVLYLVQGDAALAQSQKLLQALVAKHKPAAIAVGNGTHGRETESFVRQALGGAAQPFVVSVNEAGASVYSASEVAREELGELDLTVRGAISIARRLQDPLAELVKVDPKAIGVGQYQHDVPEAELASELDCVVQSCVNQVGVEVNTASPHLLAYVAGIGKSLAKKIVGHRDAKGPFRTRKALLKVPGLGPKTFEQAAGFLRVRGAENPLDASAVHPERYAVVEAMAKDLGTGVSALVGDAALVSRIEWQRYVTRELGQPTLEDILAELRRPGRDPRATFEPPRFRDDVRKLEDLVPGMSLEGVVTNVTAFGAFVDVGVHQDGLVHVSQLANRFVKDPSEVVKPGDKITVRVVEVDLVRKRIALSARTDGAARGAQGAASPDPQQSGGGSHGERGGGGGGRPSGSPRPQGGAPSSAPRDTRPPRPAAQQHTTPPAPPPMRDLRYNPFDKLLKK